jgi:hypothetical protein
VSGPHGFAVRSSAVRPARRAIAHGVHPALRQRWRTGAFASTTSRPAFVTTRDPPLLSERDGTNRPVIWVKRETEYFLPEVWTAQISLKSLQNSLFTRNGF